MERYLEKLFESALAEIGAPGASVKFEIPQNEQHGDLSTNVAMTLAKELRRPPREVAKEIIGRIHLDHGHLKAIEIAGPGFINVTFDKGYYTDGLRTILGSGADFGRGQSNKDRKINLEWVSANPTGTYMRVMGGKCVLVRRSRICSNGRTPILHANTISTMPATR